MNKKGWAGTLFKAMIVLFVGYLLFVAFYNLALEKECERYSEEYNIKTEWEQPSNYYGGTCYVLMKDGIRVRRSDFVISAIKEPIGRLK